MITRKNIDLGADINQAGILFLGYRDIPVSN